MARKFKPLRSVPGAVLRDFSRERKEEKQRAFERRCKARQILFGTGEGRFANLSREDADFVRAVREEAYQAYLHLFRTGQCRYQGWTKRRQLQLKNREIPITRKKYNYVWYGSQKARYRRFDLPRALKQNGEEENG